MKDNTSIDSYETDINFYEKEMISGDVDFDSKENESEDHALSFFTGTELLEKILVKVELISPEELRRVAVKKIVHKHILNKYLMRSLQAMSNYMTKATGIIQQLFNTVFRSIFLLFGMCSSRPAYIYAAIFGSSSTRIFS